MGSLYIHQWGKLTIRERIDLCHECAQEAKQLAQAAHPDLKAEYGRLAEEWHKIAAELEKFDAAKSTAATEIGERPEDWPGAM